MAIDVVMPQMGESIFEGTVSRWLKKPGDKVQRDEPLVEISTDKVDAEVPAPAAGVLKEIKVQAGQTVQVNTVLATLDAEGASAAAPAPQAAQPQVSAAAPAETVTAPAAVSNAPSAQAPRAQSAPAPAAPAPAATVAEPAASGGATVRSSPLVRRLAKENNVDLAQIPGSGSSGRVSKRDLLQFVESRGPGAPGASAAPPAAPAAPAGPSFTGPVEIVPMTLMRKRIAEHMVASKRTSPHVYSVFQVDVTRINSVREKNKREFEATTGARLTFMPFFAQATVEALKKFPIVNSSVQEDSIVYKRDVNLGIAVALDWGLIVPVIKHADEKNFLGLQRAVNDLAERARAKKLSPDDIQDGTFTISNYGIYGGLIGMPVINQPQVAILGIGGIHKTPVVVNDAIAIRSLVHLTLSFDHRVIDGSTADQFLAFMKERLEGWDSPVL